MQEPRRQAENFLKQAAGQPNYALALLQARPVRPPVLETLLALAQMQWEVGGLEATIPPPMTDCMADSLLQLVSMSDVELQVRQAASVSFKNHLKYHWVSRSRA